MNTKENKALNQWLALNKILKTSKLVGLIQGVVMILLILLCLRMYFSPPIVVTLNGDSWHLGERRAVPLSKKDIGGFIEEYIQARYIWEDFNQKAILLNIRPLVTKDFYKKLSQQLRKHDNRSIKGKKVKQVVADIEVIVGEKSIVASFYKLLVIENIPLPIFSQIDVKLKQGPRTRANKWGVYIHGIIKHEFQKS